MLYIALLLLFLAIFFFWQSNRQRQAAGLPGGRVIYTDTRGWGKLEKPLFYQALGLTGKPDYLIQQNGQIIPVEVKSSRAPEAPYDSHIYQLASYCLLAEKKRDEHKKDVARSHEQASRCARCGFRNVCDQRLT